MELENYDAARAAIARNGFTPEIQTKISLFLTAAKNAHALFLGAFELRPFVGVEQQLLHTQYFHEMEAVLLLSKVTRWTTDPSIYTEAITLTAPIWKDWPVVSGFFGMPNLDPEGYYRGLALGHGLLSQLRLAPVIPSDANEADHFVIAMRRIELDNARMQQTQMNLLRTASTELPFERREAMIEEKQAEIQVAFARFLDWLSK